MNYPSKNKLFDTESGLAWFTIPSIEDLIKAGHQMGNALSNEKFAKKYSEDNELYFLLDENEEKVLINLSYMREKGKVNMVAGYRNGTPEEKYQNDISELLLFLV